VKILVRPVDPGPAIVPVDGLPCGVPGLAITRVPSRESWSITHVRSGCSAGFFEPGTDPEAILAAAQELGAITDWTLPASEVVANRETGYQARDIVESYGGILVGRTGDMRDVEDIQ
jgi:hypothetical protein